MVLERVPHVQHAYFSQSTNQIFNFAALSLPLKNKNVSFSFQFKVTLPVPEKASETDEVVVIILSSVGSVIFLAVMASFLMYFCYWKKRQKSETKQETEVREGIDNFVPFMTSLQRDYKVYERRPKQFVQR